MYQNFDEKYVTINFDEGSTATVTQTTLAYWDSDYGKKVLTNDEQLNMYIKPKIGNAVKYLMLDNMIKLVDAKAFIHTEKVIDALKNVKYNFYTKRNVRYTILFPAQFVEINLKYMDEFEKVYEEQLNILKSTPEETKESIFNDESLVDEGKTGIILIDDSIIEKKEVQRTNEVSPKVYEQPNEFLKDVKIETEKFLIDEEYLTEQKILNYEKEKKEVVPQVKEKAEKKESRVIFREDNDFKEDKLDVKDLKSILEVLDLE